MGDRATILVTLDWQQIAVGTCIVTITKVGRKCVHFNDEATDSDKSPSFPRLYEQFRQNETVPTFIRADGLGWEVLVDGVLS